MSGWISAPLRLERSGREIPGFPFLGPKHDRGIFTRAPADFVNRDKHRQLFNPEFEFANMIIRTA